MTHILTILSSYKGKASVSTSLAHAIVDKLVKTYPGSIVTERDLGQKPVPQLNMATVGAIFTPEDQVKPEQEPLLSISDELLAELTVADILVIGLGLYNYGIPASLKAWVDEICRPGVAFYYNQKGEQVGMLTGKKVYVAIASGGIYSSGPVASWDHAVPYLKTMFASIGITDFTVYRAEGQGVPVVKETSLQKAIDSITV